MRSSIFILFILVIFNRNSRGQVSAEPISLNITYSFVHVNDLNNKNNPVKTDVVLSVGKTSSRYLNADLYNRLNAPRPTVIAGTRGAAGYPIAVVNSSGGIISEVLLQMPNSKKILAIMTLGSKDYSSEFSLTPIDWKLENETKKIGGFNCQKATGIFSGRTYTAWFAPDLPFQNGPFKLWGLPGLILQAEDSKKEVMFIFKDINRETDASKLVLLTGSRPVKVSPDEYTSAKRSYQQNPDTFMQGQLPVNAPKVTKVFEKDGGKSFGSKPINNPVELL